MKELFLSFKKYIHQIFQKIRFITHKNICKNIHSLPVRHGSISFSRRRRGPRNSSTGASRQSPHIFWVDSRYIMMLFDILLSCYCPGLFRWISSANEAGCWETLFYWQSSWGFREVNRLTRYDLVSNLDYDSPRVNDICAPILITSWNHGCVGCDYHSNWSIFYHLFSPGSKDCLGS